MDMSQGDEGPCKLLFVSRRNLPMIIRLVAPDMTLVSRRDFEAIAVKMLQIVEGVAEVEHPS